MPGETVRLAVGLTPEKLLDTASQQRAVEAPAFLREAEQALGFPIEVIAGREEARLIYLGVALPSQVSLPC